MGRIKNIQAPKPYEMKCCSVQVELDTEKLKLLDAKTPEELGAVPKEVQEHIMFPATLGKQFDYVGATPQIPFVYIMFKFDEQQKAVDYFKAITEKGYKAKLVKNPVFVDTRYLEGEMKGKLVSLPPDYIDKAIRDLFNKYGSGLHIEEDIQSDSLEYIADLGGREIFAFVGGGDKMLALGMKNGLALQTANPCGFYKKLLADFEKEIIEWRNEHSGCCKKIAEA